MEARQPPEPELLDGLILPGPVLRHCMLVGKSETKGNTRLRGVRVQWLAKRRQLWIVGMNGLVLAAYGYIFKSDEPGVQYDGAKHWYRKRGATCSETATIWNCGLLRSNRDCGFTLSGDTDLGRELTAVSSSGPGSDLEFGGDGNIVFSRQKKASTVFGYRNSILPSDYEYPELERIMENLKPNNPSRKAAVIRMLELQVAVPPYAMFSLEHLGDRYLLHPFGGTRCNKILFMCAPGDHE